MNSKSGFQKKWLLAIVGVILLILIGVVLSLPKNPAGQGSGKNSNGNVALVSPTPRGNPPPGSYSPTPKVAQSPQQQKAIEIAIKKQMAVDHEYADWQANIAEEYPWKKKMPLVDKKYYVYFDLDKKQFIGLLYPAVGDDVNAMKVGITDKLVQMGVDTNSFYFQWSVTVQR